MQKAIITDWKPEHAEKYSKETLILKHRLSKSRLFSMKALGELIDRYPVEHYSLNTMGYDPENPVWREGTIENFSGKQVIDAIKNGRMWLNLRRVN